MHPTVIVDLDRTLIHTDLLFESIMNILKKNPLYFFMFFFWIRKGRAHLKYEIANRVSIDTKTLPYNKELIWYLRSLKTDRHKLILVTASDQRYADAVAKELDLFDEVKGSNHLVNLKGSKKAQWIKEKIGSDQYTYVGDSYSDFKIWRCCKSAVVVGTKTFKKNVEKNFEVLKHFESPGVSVKTFIKAIRVHQWAKNALIFLPLLLAHRYSDLQLWTKGLLAFLSFSLCASSVYLLNDLLDLEADRQHEKKKLRPFAAGTMPIVLGLALFPLFLILSVLLSLLVTPQFLGVLVLYYFLTLFYSFSFKKMMVWDVVILALLFTIRIFAGSSALQIEISQWLLLFSLFFFLSLAFVKRVAEIVRLKNKDKMLAQLKGRGYWVSDLPTLTSLGGATGYISVLVFALYLNNTSTLSLYRNPQYLWINCFFLIYWISRIWLLTSRDQMHDDPVVFAIKDKVSYLVGLCFIISFFLAM